MEKLAIIPQKIIKNRGFILYQELKNALSNKKSLFLLKAKRK